jgi:RNA polymerase subunit RPABC4/transcription elongation factor Spt4
MIKLVDLLKEDYGGGKYELPKNHQPGMRVPVGGACCFNCRFYVNNEEKGIEECSNKQWQEWSGMVALPYPSNEYCSDWWEPR